MLGLCPFHNEKTPSFTVSPAKGIYKCFGCGKGGNAVNFIMEHEHLSYPEALKWLAKKYHIEVEEKELTPGELKKQNERESMLVVTQYASRQFTENLFHGHEGMAVGLSYFRERGYNDDILRKFEVGYCNEKRDDFSQRAIAAGYRSEFLVMSGLTIEKEGSLFDRFAGRIMFPIHSLSGQVLGFGGRILRTDARAAKYVNTPETEIYHKSRILYGIFQARQAITREECCYLVEGYTDVLSMHMAGVENVVASSGTALTQEQIRLIKRFTPNITMLYDGDPAGIKASLRGTDMILEEGMNVRIVLLPQGEDPDSYSRKVTREEFRQYLKEKETDFIRFKTSLLLDDAQGDPVRRANLVRDVVRSIAVIPDQITRTVYVKECSTQLGMAEEVVLDEVMKLRKQQSFRDRNAWPVKEGGREGTTGVGAGDVMMAGTSVTTPTQREKSRVEVTYWSEREVIRLLIRYGDEVLYRYKKKEEEREAGAGAAAGSGKEPGGETGAAIQGKSKGEVAAGVPDGGKEAREEAGAGAAAGSGKEPSGETEVPDGGKEAGGEIGAPGGSQAALRLHIPDDEIVTTVADYIIAEINDDELKLDNPLFAEIYEEITFNVSQGLIPGERHFVQHANPAISSACVDLLTEKDVLSAIWRTHGAFVETEDMKLREIVPETVLKFKGDKIKVMQNELRKAIAAAGNDEERIFALQEQYRVMTSLQKKISAGLGGRIIM